MVTIQHIIPLLNIWLWTKSTSQRDSNFQNHINKNNKRFGIKIYKSCDVRSSTHDMNAYLGKDMMSVTTDNTGMRATVKHLTKGARLFFLFSLIQWEDKKENQMKCSLFLDVRPRSPISVTDIS
jgi:hypothetical protein